MPEKIPGVINYGMAKKIAGLSDEYKNEVKVHMFGSNSVDLCTGHLSFFPTHPHTVTVTYIASPRRENHETRHFFIPIAEMEDACRGTWGHGLDVPFVFFDSLIVPIPLPLFPTVTEVRVPDTNSVPRMLSNYFVRS